MKELQKDKKACVYFHQGWSDITMCLGLINYYSDIYYEIYVLIRSDAKAFVGFYVKDLTNVNIVYINTDNGRFHGNINTGVVGDTVEYINNNVLIPANFEIMFHAEHDRYRKDNYSGYWYNPQRHKTTKHFSEMFYSFYDIDFLTRITSFSFNRDFEMENNAYNQFVAINGPNYIIYHDDETNHTHGSHHVSTKIEFNKILEGYSYVNLNKESNVFFDYIKIIQNAKEIHLVDSIWACILYQLDAKYSILNGNEVKIYCKRGHDNLFLHPITLENWKILK